MELGRLIANAPREAIRGCNYGGASLLKTVLIVDDDLGFVFWLGHALDTLSYSALPAKSVPDAAMLVMQLDLRVDLLIINPTLTGAADFISALHRSQKDARAIGILSHPSQIVNIPGISATQSKPTVFDQSAKASWLECVEDVLARRTVPWT
jgi:hypothetical protein